uniref:Reverse transcriptase domain-containing protein n=1 Tax=Tanacetum cinerariifolium TaxID=118510 RepID=A0A6L2KV29_TANCI|nr:reverse transcriptase domain-containing protein [Tanacetum cinerariifolium]
MPKGLKNSRATLQRVISKVIAKQKGQNVEVYLEETVIKSKSKQDLIEDVKETLYKLQRVNMKLDQVDVPSRWKKARVILRIVYNDLYLGEKALVERENVSLDLTKSNLCPSFVEDHPAKGVGLRVNLGVDPFRSRRGGLQAKGEVLDHLKGKVIVLPLFVMNAKDTIHIQTCKLTKEELADFLEDYPIPLQYKVMLPKRNQTVFDSPDEYPANVRIFPDPILFMAGLKPSWEHGQQQPTIIVEMAFRNFMYAKTDEDLSFLPKEPSPDFGIGSLSVSINTEPPVVEAKATG